MESPESNMGTETANPFDKSEISDHVISSVLSELKNHGFSRKDFPTAIAIGVGALSIIKEVTNPSVPVDDLLMWLRKWSGKLPNKAASSLRSMCEKAI